MQPIHSLTVLLVVVGSGCQVTSSSSASAQSSLNIGRYDPNTLIKTLAGKIGELVPVVNATKKSDTDVAEARDPSYGASTHYGHGGGGGGHGHSSGGWGWGGGGGGGGSGWGWGKGHGHGAITLDPVSIISLLALGAFLINNILQLLRANTMTVMSGRSLDVSDIDVPLELSDLAAGTRELTEAANEPNFSQFFRNVGSLYYLAPQKRNFCIKRVVCGYVKAQQREEKQPDTFKERVFDLMLVTVRSLVAPELTDSEAKDGTACTRLNKFCSDTLMQDAKAKAENKIYQHMTSFVTQFALAKLFPGGYF